MVSWTEYFDWNNDKATCDDEPYSKLTMSAPTSGGLTAHFTGTSESSGCAADSQVTLNGSTAVQENGIGNSASGDIRGSGGCLDVSGSDGTTILLYTCTGGRCLTAPATLGNAVTVATCNNSAAQRWTF